MTRWAKNAALVGTVKVKTQRAARRPLCGVLLVATVLVAGQGCARQERVTPQPVSPPRVLVVAPVLNLSGSQDFDALKVTDLVASEFQSFPDVAVVPVNLALAELERRGKTAVESPEDAVELARALGADATIVIGVTEYNPYAPPVIGWVMQWYSVPPRSAEALAAGPDEAGEAGAGISDPRVRGPQYQVQRVFNAADEDVLEQVRSFARERDGHQSPYGWRKYIRSQELYVRFSCAATIRSMLAQDKKSRTAVKPDEAKS